MSTQPTAQNAIFPGPFSPPPHPAAAAMSANVDDVPFTARYGLYDHQLGQSIYWSRHGKVINECARGQCRTDDRLRCQCPGATDRQCCQQMSAEDLLCDWCRDYCWATDGVNPSVRIIHDRPPAQPSHQEDPR